jgi:hypothetical protein
MLKKYFAIAAITMAILSFNNMRIDKLTEKLSKIKIENKINFTNQSTSDSSITLIKEEPAKLPATSKTSVEQTIHKVDDRFKDIKVKGIYMSGPSIGSSKTLNNIIKLENETELNSVVIDIKDDYGKIDYATKVERAVSIGAFHRYYDPKSVIEKLHQNNIYVIGRIVTFKDPILGTRCPELAIKRTNGQIYKENNFAWVDPFKKEVWDYNIEIAKEAISLGFDEIQFDYVRFPAVNNHELKLSITTEQKTDAIDGFLSLAYEKLNRSVGAKVSANVFGIICETPKDVEGIGQDVEKVGKDIDYISPMIYPSHFANKAQNGSGQIINGVKFSAPDLMAYQVVYNSLIKAKKRILKVKDYKASIRPYLQGFTASWLARGYYKKYTPEDIRQQIKAVYDAGYQEWILWNASNKYNQNEFLKSN